MELSSYLKSDKAEIKHLFENVFSESEGLEEGILIANLVNDLMNNTSDRDIFGFVSKDKGKLTGAIFFTRLFFDTQIEAFILAPVAVITKFQGKGIGQKLIDYGIEQLKRKGVQLVFTYGDPNFYSKSGFQSISENIIKAPCDLTYPQGWLCQSLNGSRIAPILGTPRCVKALDKPEYW